MGRAIAIHVSAEQGTEFCLSRARLLGHLHTRESSRKILPIIQLHPLRGVGSHGRHGPGVGVYRTRSSPPICATGGAAEAPWLGQSRQGISQGRVTAWSKRGPGCQRSSLEISRAAFYFCRSFYTQRRILKVDFWINLKLFGVLCLK